MRLLTVDPEMRITLDEIKKHKFYQMGLKYQKDQEIISDHKTISNKTIEKMLKMGFNLQEIKHSVKNNELNPVTTTFNLIYKRLKSNHYRKTLSQASI